MCIKNPFSVLHVVLGHKTAMDQTFTLVLLLLSFYAAFSCKYVFVRQRLGWNKAQKYCRQHHTDLAPVSNKHDMRKLTRLSDSVLGYYWIGLIRNSTDREKWMWSGGGEVTRFFWAWNQPSKGTEENYGAIHYDVWHDALSIYPFYFYCYSAHVVREKKTWLEALEYCRKHHDDLASVASQTEMMLIKKELARNETTENVWIGLHFFPGGWLWVDRQPLSYKSWGQEGESECPEYKMSCAALKVVGRSRSGTLPALVNNATTLSDHIHANMFGPSQRVNILVADEAAADVEVREWEAHNCEERLHFICY